MQEHIWVRPDNLSGLNIYQYGREDCAPHHSFGPAVRDHYLLHFILKGRGVFSQEHKRFSLTQGQGFLICPDTITYYEADAAQPWSYLWIGFNSDHASKLLRQCGVSQASPIFVFPDREAITRIFDAMKAADEKSRQGQLQLVGWFYLLLAQMKGSLQQGVPSSGSLYGAKEAYIQSAIEYIQKHYARRIRIEEIAQYIGLNRSYFGVVFREHTGMSPQEFLIQFRVKKACQLLQNHHLTVGDVARSVGYDDPLLFSKIFKKIQGVSPSVYRQNEPLR